jgi:hypothetical protein
MNETSFTQARHPRTAVGVTAAGELLLVVADGRQGFSRGVTLPEMAKAMLKYGAIQAINLDGGGSSQMVVRGLYVNGPSDGYPRPVANALVVTSDAPLEVSETAGVPLALRAGERRVLPLEPDLLVLGEPLWGTVDGRGFVDQRGAITATRAGQATAGAVVGGRRVTVPLTVSPGPPATLKAVLTAAPNNPPDRNTITVTVTDAYGNPIEGQTVRFHATGGVPDQPEAVTDKAGRVVIEVVWDVEKGRSVSASSGPLGPIKAK